MRNFANLKTPVFLSRLLSALPVDFALEAFACIKDDEHLVERKEVSSYKSTWRSRGLSNTALDVSYKCKFISSYLESSHLSFRSMFHRLLVALTRVSHHYFPRTCPYVALFLQTIKMLSSFV